MTCHQTSKFPIYIRGTKASQDNRDIVLNELRKDKCAVRPHGGIIYVTAKTWQHACKWYEEMVKREILEPYRMKGLSMWTRRQFWKRKKTWLMLQRQFARKRPEKQETQTPVLNYNKEIAQTQIDARELDRIKKGHDKGKTRCRVRADPVWMREHGSKPRKEQMKLRSKLILKRLPTEWKNKREKGSNPRPPQNPNSQ